MRDRPSRSEDLFVGREHSDLVWLLKSIDMCPSDNADRINYEVPSKLGPMCDGIFAIEFGRFEAISLVEYFLVLKRVHQFRKLSSRIEPYSSVLCHSRCPRP